MGVRALVTLTVTRPGDLAAQLAGDPIAILQTARRVEPLGFGANADAERSLALSWHAARKRKAFARRETGPQQAFAEPGGSPLVKVEDELTTADRSHHHHARGPALETVRL